MLTEARLVEEFLNDYRRSRVIIESSVRASLNRALEFEKQFQKPFYEFTIDEVLEMYKSINAISIRSIQNVNLTLKHASRYILHQQGKEITNVYDNITKELVETCIDTNKQKNLVLSREDLTNIQNELINYTDKCILEMLFLGVGGQWLKELTFFDISQASRKDGMLYFKTGKVIKIDNDAYELIKAACNEDELVSFGETSRISQVKSFGIYKARFNALSDNDDITDDKAVERRYRFIQRRLMLIAKDLEISITSGSIQESGFLYYIKEGMAANNMEFLEYIKTKECQNLAKRYDLYTNLYVQVIKEKFLKYFI